MGRRRPSLEGATGVGDRACRMSDKLAERRNEMPVREGATRSSHFSSEAT
jgi:hypothetical protein